MNILLITTDIGSGSGWNRYSAGICDALTQRGHTVGAIVGESATDASEHAAWVLRMLPNPTSVRRNNLLFPLHVLQALVAHGRALRSYDMIHCVVESYAPFAWLLALILRKPFVITAHGSFAVKPFVLHRAEFLFAHIYRSAKALICVSEFTRARLASYAPYARAVVLHNGVDVRPVAMSDGTHPLVLCVGALKYRKGFHLLLEAFAHIAARIPSAECMMLGDRNEESYVQALEERIRELGLSERVHIRSGVGDAELDALYARTRVFVLAPVSTPDEFEGFGLVYLEANMHGVPTIGMEGSGAPEAIQEGKSGYIVPEGDVAALSAKMEAIMTDDVLWEGLSVGAQKWAQSHAWSEVAASLEVSYRP